MDGKGNRKGFAWPGPAAVLLCLVLTVIIWIPFAAHAAEKKKTVRVGWFESAWNTKDKYGRRTGYAYEYQSKIASYTGWNYEYVEASWPQLLEMLKKGEIDLLGDVSYTEERTKDMLFPSYSMGTEEYYLFISEGNKEYSQGVYSYFNGKKIGVNKGSVQAELFQNWIKAHKVHPEVIEVSGEARDSINMVINGELDGMVMVDSYNSADAIVPVAKIGSSDYYFAVNKYRQDLLAELESALDRIQDENRFYAQTLYEKYFKGTGVSVYLDAEELRWIEGHRVIKVGYQDDYLAYCARDPKSGELTGALKDYLDTASDCLANAHLDFKATAYPTASAAMEALKNGEVDCIFPSDFSIHDAEQQGVALTPTVMSAEICALIRSDDKDNFSPEGEVVVAAIGGDINYDTIIKDHFPDWKATYYEDTEACLDAVEDRRADCFLISNYRYNNLRKLCEKYHLTIQPTNVNINYGWAVAGQEIELYSVLAKVAGLIPATTVNASLTRYYEKDATTGINDFIRDHVVLVIVLALAFIALIVVIIMQQQKIRAGRVMTDARESKKR